MMRQFVHIINTIFETEQIQRITNEDGSLRTKKCKLCDRDVVGWYPESGGGQGVRFAYRFDLKDWVCKTYCDQELGVDWGRANHIIDADDKQEFIAQWS